MHNPQQLLHTKPMAMVLIGAIAILAYASSAFALPLGYQAATVALNGPPSGLAYAPNGKLFVYENPPFMDNSAVVRVLNPDFTFGSNLAVTGLDSTNLYIGSMAYDPVTGGALITDNAGGAGALYSLSPTCTQTTIFSGLPSVAGVAVRSSGEIFISTAPYAAGQGKVYQVNRTTGVQTPVLTGLDFGAGLAFDNTGNLIVQDANFSTYTGRLQKLPITSSGGGLSFGTPTPLLAGMQAGAGVAVDSEGDLFATGSGGLFRAAGNPLTASNFDNNGDPFQFSSAISYFAGNAPFEPYAGGTSRLAFQSDFGFSQQTNFISIISPVTLLGNRTQASPIVPYVAPGGIEIASGSTYTLSSVTLPASGASLTTAIQAAPGFALVNEFATLNVPGSFLSFPGDSLSRRVSVLYEGRAANGSGIVDTMKIGIAQPGDLSFDNDVDFDDIFEMINNFGSTGVGWRQGDNDNDTDVDFDDVFEAINAYGASYSTSSSPTIIPEPSSALLLIVGGPILLRACRRRKRHSQG